MKRNAITILLFLFSAIIVYSQTVINNPKTGFSTSGNVNLTKIEVSDTATILSFRTYSRPGDWISIPDKTYIQDTNGTEKMYIKSAEGIKVNEQYIMPESGNVTYRLFFPPIAKTTAFIDYGEGNDGGSWFIYDIATKSAVSQPSLPKELMGNWFDKATGDWEFGFYDKQVVYKNKLWSYSFPKGKKSSNSIKLTGDGEMVDVFYKISAPGTVLLGLSAQSLKEYSNNATEAKKVKPIDDKPYELPVFKIDSATYSGYIKGYTPRVGVKTLSVYINDIITGKQNTFVIRISENGFFSIKLPVYYPNLCFVSSSIYTGSVFLEPGKEVFQLLGAPNPLFMGELAKVNSDIDLLSKIRSSNYRDIQRKILDISPAQYKAYNEICKTENLSLLDSIMKTNTISTRAYQVTKMNFEYECATNKMFYDYYWESAYREKNKIPDTQRMIPVKSDSLTAEYFDFINNEAVNNPLAVISSGYNSYMNILKYLDILKSVKRFTYDLSSMALEIEKSGDDLTDYEKILIEKIKEIDLIEKSAEEKSYNEKYLKSITDFYTKYNENITRLCKENPKADFTNFGAYFKENKVQLTDAEQALIKVMVKHSKTVSAIKQKQLYEVYGDSINSFTNRHSGIMTEKFTQIRNTGRDEILKKQFNVQLGFGRDIMIAQDYCRNIVEEVSPVSDKKLKAIQQQISTPFIAEYVALCNNQAIAKLEANKKKTGFVVNETPKTEAAKVFDAIIRKYKGKVIYVDFWATWCGPCRSGIEQIKPLKEELAGKDVVFVYITNQTSPQNTWSNMIPDIKGEHYRVSNDEWNFLTAMFNVSGIPHYVLVGKTGEIINPNLGHVDNGMLKTELEKYIKE